MIIRPYEARDWPAVRTLFILINRDLAPVRLRAEFEAYIARSLLEEIDRIPDYYAARAGSFWIAEDEGCVTGMYGVECIGPAVAELRRMYVAPAKRRRRIASALLRHAEDWCRAAGVRLLSLSTSELQPAALALYRSSGYRLVREETAAEMTNKTLGGGLRRFYLEKSLEAPAHRETG